MSELQMAESHSGSYPSTIAQMQYLITSLTADNAKLRELLGEALERIPHWQKCAIFDNPEEPCDCERSDIQSRIQSALREE